VQNQANNEKSVIQICTKPLSPQSTSEDFKIYLANIQYLQSASNILNQQQLKNLNRLFQKSYCNQNTDTVETKFEVLNCQIDDSSAALTDDEEKRLLINLHHGKFLKSGFECRK
jgi:hypothetical protein